MILTYIQGHGKYAVFKLGLCISDHKKLVTYDNMISDFFLNCSFRGEFSYFYIREHKYDESENKNLLLLLLFDMHFKNNPYLFLTVF